MNLPWVGNEFETKNPCTSSEVIFETNLVSSDWMERDYFFQYPEISHKCGFQGIRKETTFC